MKKLLFILLFVAIGASSVSAQVRLRANALGWAAVAPNLGVEVGLSKHLTFVAEGYVSPLWDMDNFKAKGYLITPELRYYFCESFNKHYIGVHGNIGEASDLKLASNQHIRKDATVYGVGITYGHQWLFNHHWSLDVFGGLGWWHIKSDNYSRCEPTKLLAENATRDLFFPSRLGVTFGYRF